MVTSLCRGLRHECHYIRGTRCRRVSKSSANPLTQVDGAPGPGGGVRAGTCNGKVLFFTSNVSGVLNIHWVDSSFVERFRPEKSDSQFLD